MSELETNIWSSSMCKYLKPLLRTGTLGEIERNKKLHSLAPRGVPTVQVWAEGESVSS